MKKAFAVLVLLMCLVGCSANRAQLGSYVFVENSKNWHGEPTTGTYTIELKANDECVFSKSGYNSIPTIAGKYTLDGNTITFTVMVRGTNQVGKAHFENQTIVLDDRGIFESGMQLTKQN